LPTFNESHPSQYPVTQTNRQQFISKTYGICSSKLSGSKKSSVNTHAQVFPKGVYNEITALGFEGPE
jgi:hypothetical protein